MSIRRRSLGSFARSRRGAAAIETAFIAPVFFALVFSVCEAGWFFFRSSMVDQAVLTASRTVMTGSAPKPGEAGAEENVCTLGETCFYDQICEKVEMFGECAKQLSVEVRAFDSMAALTAATDAMTCPNAPGYKAVDMSYEPGDRYDYVRVRVCFLMKTLNPALGLSLAQNPDGTRSLVTMQVRRNEPYVSFDDDETL